MGISSDLAPFLRPAGSGLLTVTTGSGAAADFHQGYYGVTDARAVQALWQGEVAGISNARVAVVGVPSDTGAGLGRGAAFAPRALRTALLDADPAIRSWMSENAIVDLGDIPVIPQLLHDEMLSAQQLDAARAALYPALPLAASYPVSPLSLLEHVLRQVMQINPSIRIFVLGGDHSVAWPAVAALAAHGDEPLGIVQPDAHTDLLEHRFGVKYCFATWAFHANACLGAPGRLVQVGIRTSSRSKSHWESTLGVRQIWADEALRLGLAGTVDAVVAALSAAGVRRVYFSNDIDGTTPVEAPSTGAPEPGGLPSEFVLALIEAVATHFDLCGADLVEVAPPLGTASDRDKTLKLGARYVLASLRSLVQSAGNDYQKGKGKENGQDGAR